jgi:biotin carboxylase
MAVTSGTPRTEAYGKTVLIGFGEAFAAIEAAWSLRAAGFRVTAFSRSGQKPALRHVRGVKIYEVHPPEVNARRTVDDVRGLIRSLNPAAYLPLDDAAVWIAGELTGEGVPHAGPSGNAVGYALDKQLQLDAAREAGLPVPPTEVVPTQQDLARLQYPVVVKPAKALYLVDGRLVRPTGRVYADSAEFSRIETRPWYQPMLVQPLLHGTGEGLFGHATKHGVVCWSAHRRIRMVNPQGSASSACTSIPVDESLIGPAERFLQRIGWRGLFMLEFLRDSRKRPWLMELNGRAWGSMALARRRGFEYPAWTVQSAIDETFVPAPPAQPPDVVCRHLGMELVHLAFVVRGPSSKALTEWPSIWSTIRELVRISRRDRLYNWKRSEPDVLVADTLKTLSLYLRQAMGRQR